MLNLPSKSNHGIEMTVLRDFFFTREAQFILRYFPEKRYHITFFIFAIQPFIVYI